MDSPLGQRSVEELEDVAARAVPAAETVGRGGWLLRATPGLATKRANSVLARAGAGVPAELAERLDAVEAFYAGRGLPARYQLSPASSPPGLAEVLLARGYHRSAPVEVQLGTLETMAALSTPDRLRATVTGAADGAWWQTWGAAVGVESARIAAVAALFGRIASETGFACAREDGGEVVAVGMAVRDGDWAGFFDMATLPEHRGRGAGRAALQALARWARGRGARRGYLQVETGNDPARALYRRAGLRAVYRYAYLTREVPRADVTEM